MKTSKLILVFAVILSAKQTIAQSDTIFFDKDWKKTSSAAASYFRTISKEGKLFHVEDCYINGMLQMTGNFSSLDPETKEGIFKYYYDDGVVSGEGLYIEDKKEGEWKSYDSLGRIRNVKNYANGNLHGNKENYYPSGKIKRKESYIYGKFVNGHCYAETGEEITFFDEEQAPSFVGGMGGLTMYLQQNLVYPPSAYRRDIQGKVYLRFVVSETGKVSDIKVTRGVHPLLDAEAISVVSKMPEWIPGKIDGVPVKSYFDLPINFRLD